MKVLIVEDNADSRNLLLKQLSAYGHEVTAAVDGLDALEKAQKSPPDILVSDILMPRMDGYKLCYEWKQHKQLKDIPFVFYTAIYTSSEDEKFALSLGANLFIRKPLEPEALAKILSQAFEQAREGLLPPAKAPLAPSLYLTEYNKRLVAKLNEKVAELEKSEEELRYLSSVLGAIRNINQLIVRERDKTKLLRGACRILLKVREYRFVWIGLIEEGHKRVIPVARAGVEDSYLDKVEITWDDSESGQGPPGMAIKTKKPELIKNIPESSMCASWREEARKRGYRSSAAIPIIHDDRVYGALNVYSSQPDGFNEAEVELLVEVGSDLAFALKAIERQEARQQAEEALRESEEKFFKAFHATSNLMAITAVETGRVIDVNEAYALQVGYKREEIIGNTTLELNIWADPEQRKELLKRLQEKGTVQDFEVRVRTKSGEIRTALFSADIITLKGEPCLISTAVDITERKQTEDALQQSYKRFNDIAENALEWIWEVDAEGKYTYASPVVEQILGYKPEEVIGKHFYDLFHPDDREELKKAAFAAFAEKQSFRQFVNRNIHKNGEIIWLATSGVPILDEAGNLLGYRGADVDITERMQAEEELRESEAFQSGLLSNSPVPITVVNPDGSLRYVSPALERLTGFSAEELIGQKPPYSYWPKERRQEIIKHFEKAIQQGGKGVVELYQKKNGEKLWVEITTTPVKKDGEFQYLLGSWVDITERKQAEEALRESEARYRAVVEGAHDMIQSVSLDGGIIFVNKSWLDTLGYTEADLASLNLFDIIHPDSQKHCRKIMAEVAKGEPVRSIEAAFLTKDGRKILVEGNATPRYIGNRVVASHGIFRDVTERKQAEDKLRDEATRRRILIDQSSDGIAILDEQGKIYEANQRFAEMLGYTPEEARELHVWDFEALLNREQILERIRTMDESGDHFETQHRRKDGTVFDVEISSNSAVYEGQKLIFSVCRDITERKRAEAALADEATRHRILIDESSDGIVILDERGKVYEANRRFAEMLGYTPKEVRELSVWDWEFQYPREQVAEMIRTVDETGDHFETRHRRKDGTIFDVEISTNGAVYAGQKLIFCVCRDITERRQAEAALRESEEKYKNLVGATSDIIWETDAEGWFTFISPKVKDILGYKVDEVVGKKRTLDFVPKEQFPRWLKRFKEINARKGSFFGLEIPHLHKNGRQVIFETSGIPLFDSAGELKGFVGINRDVTERRHMQEQLVITDRLASVGELAAGIAHELNNPLTGVIGFSQLLLDREMPEDIKQDIKVVYSEAQRASQVVKNLLTFARKHAAAKERVNINDIIKKVLELRAYEQNLENIIVDARFDPKLPEIMVDYFQLQQVFLNVIINAEYFMKEAHHKGKLTITTERVDNKVRASFADDGSGIAKENLGHLFDPFFTTKEVGKGTGLGLSICHGIIAEHGGRIYVESEPGKGAIFIVELPIGAAERKGGAA